MSTLHAQRTQRELGDQPEPLQPENRNHGIEQPASDNIIDQNDLPLEADLTLTDLMEDLMERPLEFEVDPDDEESSESDLDDLFHDYDYEDTESDDNELENVIERPDNNVAVDEQTADDVPLYKDATVTKLAAHAMVHLFAMEHKLSNQALSDLIRIMNVLLPGHKFASSTYMLKKYFVGRFQEPLPIKHKYCGSCLEILLSSSGTDTNDVCKNKTCQELDCPAEEFLEVDLCNQLARLYKGIVHMIAELLIYLIGLYFSRLLYAVQFIDLTLGQM